MQRFALVPVSMAGRTRLYPARDASASSDVGLPKIRCVRRCF